MHKKKTLNTQKYQIRCATLHINTSHCNETENPLRKCTRDAKNGKDDYATIIIKYALHRKEMENQYLL